MKLALAALLIVASTLPAEAKPGRYNFNSGWAEEEKCFRREYREEYVPGTAKNPGYVKSYKKKVRIPCKKNNYIPQTYRQNRVDDNSCIEGAVLGGISGAGLGAALSRKEGRLWAIPLGIVSGSMVGCQIDGG